MTKQSFILFFTLLILIATPVFGQKKSTVEKYLEKNGLQRVSKEIPGIEVYMA